MLGFHKLNFLCRLLLRHRRINKSCTGKDIRFLSIFSNRLLETDNIHLQRSMPASSAEFEFIDRAANLPKEPLSAVEAPTCFLLYGEPQLKISKFLHFLLARFVVRGGGQNAGLFLNGFA